MADVISLSTGQIHAGWFVAWLFVLLFLSTLTELLIANDGEGSRVVSRATQTQLFSAISPLPETLRESDEIQLLGGTFKSFTDDVDNLRALGARLQARASVKVLMLHPTQEGTRAWTRERRARGATLTDDHLQREILNSLARMVDELGQEQVLKTVRLYAETPHNSVYRMDDKFVVTLYTFGRGSSSPSLFFTQTEENKGTCAALRAAFDDLWSASTTTRLTPELLEGFRQAPLAAP